MISGVVEAEEARRPVLCVGGGRYRVGGLVGTVSGESESLA